MHKPLFLKIKIDCLYEVYKVVGFISLRTNSSAASQITKYVTFKVRLACFVVLTVNNTFITKPVTPECGQIIALTQIILTKQPEIIATCSVLMLIFLINNY